MHREAKIKYLRKILWAILLYFNLFFSWDCAITCWSTCCWWWWKHLLHLLKKISGCLHLQWNSNSKVKHIVLYMVLMVTSTLTNLAVYCRKWTEGKIQLYLPLKDSIFHLWSTCSSTGLCTLVQKADEKGVYCN